MRGTLSRWGGSIAVEGEKKIETRNFVVTLNKKGITLWNDRVF